MTPNGIITLQIEKLKKEQEQTRLRLAHLRETIKSEVDPSIDEADFELVEHELTMALIRRLECRLSSIDEALQQMQRGTYGICERCGKPIDPARLEAMPETTLCLQCKLIVEQQARLRPREA